MCILFLPLYLYFITFLSFSFNTLYIFTYDSKASIFFSVIRLRVQPLPAYCYILKIFPQTTGILSFKLRSVKFFLVCFGLIKVERYLKDDTCLIYLPLIQSENRSIWSWKCSCVVRIVLLSDLLSARTTVSSANNISDADSIHSHFVHSSLLQLAFE